LLGEEEDHFLDRHDWLEWERVSIADPAIDALCELGKCTSRGQEQRLSRPDGIAGAQVELRRRMFRRSDVEAFIDAAFDVEA